MLVPTGKHWLSSSLYDTIQGHLSHNSLRPARLVHRERWVQEITVPPSTFCTLLLPETNAAPATSHSIFVKRGGIDFEVHLLVSVATYSPFSLSFESSSYMHLQRSSGKRSIITSGRTQSRIHVYINSIQ
jgi:hypothetical protein